MLILVSGGSGSGKSAFAESLVMRSDMDCRLYLATMRVWDRESEARVARHRAMRADKGFDTLEVPENLDSAVLPLGCAALLEDLPNLLANELFGSSGPEKAQERILSGLCRANERADLLVIVTGELCSDGADYQPETKTYLNLLAEFNRRLAAKADMVYEVVCGIPICHKESKQ